MTRLHLPCTPSCWQMATSWWPPARLQTTQVKVLLIAECDDKILAQAGLHNPIVHAR